MPFKRMFLKLTLTLCVLFIACIGTSAKSSLWKVTSKNQTMHILGSVHVLKADNYPLADEIEVAYSNSTALLLEVDMGAMMDPATQQMILGKAMLKAPNNLQSVLKAETYNKLAEACEEANLPIATIQQFKPWFATISLTQIKMGTMGLSPQYGVDQHFYDRAQKDKKPVTGLETIEFQIDLFESLADLNPDEFVAYSLNDLDQLESIITDLLVSWEQGDVEKLDALLSESLTDYPQMYEQFISARNKTWAKILTQKIKDDQTYMVVVGAGHLGGKGGLLNLLKKQGFKLEQM